MRIRHLRDGRKQAPLLRESLADVVAIFVTRSGQLELEQEQ